MDKKNYYKSIPKVDILIENEQIKDFIKEHGREIVLQFIRKSTDELREFINFSDSEENINKKINSLLDDIINSLKDIASYNLKKVINGTGTILHTNLGRAILSERTAEIVKKLTTGYCNLEYDLEYGERGSRYSHFEKIITTITKAESAMAVNNNAAAVLLILSTLAENKEVIVSRGELVEIGGSFRIPDVMEQSGCKLVEVGTTNKTRLSDYEKAIGDETAVILKVHTSNYKIVGFTESVSINDLVELGKKHNLPVIEDIGSGVLVNLEKYGLSYEPTVQDSVKAGADIVCFSGDKLLGGPQAGVIVGKKCLIDKIKKHPLTRALRIDKFTAIALESTFHEYLTEERALNNIPVMMMINKNFTEIQKQAEYLHDKLNSKISHLCNLYIEDCESQVGGGSLPHETLNSKCISFRPINMTCQALEKRLRNSEIPIVGRVANDKLLLDLRTISKNETEIVYDTFLQIFDCN